MVVQRHSTGRSARASTAIASPSNVSPRSSIAVDSASDSLDVTIIDKPITLSQQQQQSPSYFNHNLIAGVCSGTATSIVCAPLDLLRTRMQVLGDVNKGSGPREMMSLMRHMWRTEGVAGYFRGLNATLWTVPAFWGVYFPLYEELKQKGFQHRRDYHPSLIHMGSAVGAGVVADVLLNPMFVIRTRLQTEALHTTTGTPAPSILQTARAIYSEAGLAGFWRGMAANLLGLSHVAVQFPVYEYAKEYLQVDQATTPGPLLLASAVSKLVACVLTYPHEVVRSRMMDARNTTTSLSGTVLRIVQQEGVIGLYAGLPLSVIRVLPNTAVTFCVYEWTVKKLKSAL